LKTEPFLKIRAIYFFDELLISEIGVNLCRQVNNHWGFQVILLFSNCILEYQFFYFHIIQRLHLYADLFAEIVNYKQLYSLYKRIAITNKYNI